MRIRAEKPHAGREPWEDVSQLEEDRGNGESVASMRSAHARILWTERARLRREREQQVLERERRRTLDAPCRFCGKEGFTKDANGVCTDCGRLREWSAVLIECGAPIHRSEAIAAALLLHPTFIDWTSNDYD